jgi:hypothetical protein
MHRMHTAVCQETNKGSTTRLLCAHLVVQGGPGLDEFFRTYRWQLYQQNHLIGANLPFSWNIHYPCGMQGVVVVSFKLLVVYKNGERPFSITKMSVFPARPLQERRWFY